MSQCQGQGDILSRQKYGAYTSVQSIRNVPSNSPGLDDRKYASKSIHCLCRQPLLQGCGEDSLSSWRHVVKNRWQRPRRRTGWHIVCCNPFQEDMHMRARVKCELLEPYSIQMVKPIALIPREKREHVLRTNCNHRSGGALCIDTR